MNPDRMLATEKDQLAAQVMEHWAEFQESLSAHKDNQTFLHARFGLGEDMLRPYKGNNSAN